MKTSKEYTAKNFMGYGDITVPAGTKVTHKTALGDDPNYHFVDEYGWIKKNYPTVANILMWDVSTHGINIPKEFIDK